MQSPSLIWLGAILIIGGVLYSAWRALWGGRAFSRRERAPSARGLGIRSHWPSLVLVALGAILLLGQAALRTPPP